MTVAEVHAQVDDRLRDLRADAADDAVGPHQPGGRDRLQQVLGDQRVHRRHAGDVDDRDARAPVSTIRWSRVSMTTWVRALSSVPIIGRPGCPPRASRPAWRAPASPAAAGDDLLAASSGRPRWCRGRACRAESVAAQISSASARASLDDLGRSRANSGFLSENTNDRRLRRREALPGPGLGDRGQQIAHGRPRRTVEAVGAGLGDRLPHEPEELGRLLLELVILDEVPPAGRRAQLQVDPRVEQILLVTLENIDKGALSGRAHGNSFLRLNGRRHNTRSRGRRAETSWSVAPEAAGPSRPAPRDRWARSGTRRRPPPAHAADARRRRRPRSCAPRGCGS